MGSLGTTTIITALKALWFIAVILLGFSWATTDIEENFFYMPHALPAVILSAGMYIIYLNNFSLIWLGFLIGTLILFPAMHLKVGSKLGDVLGTAIYIIIFGWISPIAPVICILSAGLFSMIMLAYAGLKNGDTVILIGNNRMIYGPQLLLGSVTTLMFFNEVLTFM